MSRPLPLSRQSALQESVAQPLLGGAARALGGAFAHWGKPNGAMPKDAVLNEDRTVSLDDVGLDDVGGVTAFPYGSNASHHMNRSTDTRDESSAIRTMCRRSVLTALGKVSWSDP